MKSQKHRRKKFSVGESMQMGIAVKLGSLLKVSVGSPTLVELKPTLVCKPPTLKRGSPTLAFWVVFPGRNGFSAVSPTLEGPSPTERVENRYRIPFYRIPFGTYKT